MSTVSNFRLSQAWLVTLVLSLAAAWGSHSSAAVQEIDSAEIAKGEKIWQAQCAVCHGTTGEGVKGKFERRIDGPRSIDELASLIDQTMPEDDPDACVDAEARAVGEYMLARMMAAPPEADRPRIELMHLTTTQYANAIADLFENFLGDSKSVQARGLNIRYFDARDVNREKLVEEQVGHQLDFDWGDGGPLGEKTSAEEFCVAWSGSIYAPTDGIYRFFVESPNGYRLFVNLLSEPVLDNWVSTKEEPEKSVSIRLLGGRWYSLALHVHKVKDPPVSIRMTWQPPHRARSPIALEYLMPESSQPVVVVQTPFPADDGSVGYPRGTLVSPEWDQATTDAALEVGELVATHLPRLSWTKPDDPELSTKARAFCRRFATFAFRRELDDDEFDRYVDAFFDSSGDPRSAARASVMAVLKSPWFLYLGLNDGHPESVAESLAWTMSDSLPSKSFIEMGRALQSNPDETQALLAAFDNPRVRNKWNDFFLTWLKIYEGASISKDAEAFTGFDGQLVDDLQASAIRLVDEVVWSEKSDFRQLLLADHVWLNHRLATFYFPEIADTLAEQPDEFKAVALEDGAQAGLLTHPLLLSQLAYFRSSSPIYRGVFVSRNLMGIPLKPPPVAVEPLGEDFDPNMTTRERVEFQTRPENCMSCHQVINPLGFALERFDAVGRVRETDRDRAINDSVTLPDSDGAKVEIAGARELAEYLVRQRETARHFVETVFHHAVKQPVAAYGERELDRLTDSFIQNDYNIKKLIIEIAANVALHDRTASESGESDVD